MLATQVNRTHIAKHVIHPRMSAGDRLRAIRTAAGVSTRELGERAAKILGRDKPLHPSTIRNQESGINGISPEAAAAYAQVLKVNPADIIFGDGVASSSGVVASDDVRMVGIIGEIRAGQFTEVPENEPEPWEYVPVSLPEYARAHLFGLRVVGRSMDRYYPDGSDVIVCPAHEAGIREGDHVVVRIRRGSLAETTLKEIAVEQGGVVLWPRSTDAAYQNPIRLSAMRDSDDGPEIIGVVVGSFVSRAARAGPLLAL